MGDFDVRFVAPMMESDGQHVTATHLGEQNRMEGNKVFGFVCFREVFVR